MRVTRHQPGEKQHQEAARYLWRMRHKIFVAYVALMVLIFLAPVPSAHLPDSSHLDKLVHFGIFLVFALLFHVDRAPSAWWAVLTAFAFAAAIELVQAVLPYRDGDSWDFVAGAAGATCGTLLMLWFARQARHADPS